MLEVAIKLAGLFAFVFLAWLLSRDRARFSWRALFWGLGLQLVLGLLILGAPRWGFQGPLKFLFLWANDALISFLGFSAQGAEFVFGDFANVQKYGFSFAFQVLPAIIFFSALMSLLYHFNVMQQVVRLMAWVMHKTLGASGAESASVAANVFVGQIEGFLAARVFLKNMTPSELLCIMVGGMATVAGGVMMAYVGWLVERVPDIAGHLLTASVMSAPAAIMVAKILYPEDQKPESLNAVPKTTNLGTTNWIHAATQGSYEGLQMALNVGAMLIAAMALIAVCDAGLAHLGVMIGFNEWGGALVPKMLGSSEPVLSLSVVVGWVFCPVALLLGVPWSEALVAGSLLGQKMIINEFVAYLELTKVMHLLSDHSVVVLSYALCGFANFSSIAIQVEGMRPLAPNQCRPMAQLGVRAVIGGSLAAFLTASIAGLLI